MQASFILYVGSIGQSIWRSDDGGETFRRCSSGAPSESDVRAFSIDPRDPNRLLLGAETGLYASSDGGENWRRTPLPVEGLTIWSLARDPRDPDLLLLGGSPPCLLRSEDGGESWTPLDASMPDRCVNGAPLTPRVTSILIDAARDTLYAGIEIGGVRRSRDGGRSWDALGDGLSSQDVHGLAAPPGEGLLLATTNNDVNVSHDDGESWRPLGVDSHWPWNYARACQATPDDPAEIWVGAGNGPPGDEGGVFRTRDAGESWERLPLPQTANSTIWNFAFHPSDPARVFAASVSGEIYATEDRGASWRQLKREFGEVRVVAWTPAPAGAQAA